MELLLVIAIASVIFAFSAPFALNFYRTQLINDVQSNIVNALERARHNAVLQKNDSNFGVHMVAGSYTIFQTPDLTYDQRISELDEIFPIVDGITFTGEMNIVFSKLTGQTATTSTTTVVYESLARQIVIESSGSIIKVEASKNNGAEEIGGSCVATGGTVTMDGDYAIHTFTTSGTFTVTSGSCDAEVLVVAGGGGGGGNHGGGGAAGGLCYQNARPLASGDFTVTVGSGGTGNDHGGGGGTNGGNSIFDDITALGGGYGGGYVSGTGPTDGGSGAGGTARDGYTTGGASTQIDSGGATCYGNAGGSAAGRTEWQGGGGGGAGAVGGDSGTKGGNGGVGLSYLISGSAVYYAGGGGGSGEYQVPATIGLGGNGGGGDGGAEETDAIAGEDYTGGGGGGQRNGSGKNGGKGVVIIRHLGTGSDGGDNGGDDGGEETPAGLTTGLFSYCPLDGNTNDYSGNGNDCTWTGTASYAAGIVGQAASLVYGDSYLHSPAMTFSPAGSYTVSFWLNKTGAEEWVMTSSLLGTGIPSNSFQGGSQISSGNLWSGLCEAWSYCNSPTGTYSISQNIPYLLTLVYVSNQDLKLYLNGAYLETVSLYSQCSEVEENLAFGAEPWSPSGYFTGLIDEIAVWNRELSPSEIAQLCNDTGSGCTGMTLIVH